ncbi:MAG: kdgK [Gammaproteobacteria bacterium]|jgi:sugar/nucleoside kinase (ribokinase family)|nr:kdgK [Gammaproteobacteria bacterium]
MKNVIAAPHPLHVYGLGNALVDTAIEVNDRDLIDLQIDKGLMTLIDEERALQIALAFHDLPHTRACGGSAANTMIALAQFGGQGFYACRVANDGDGHFYLEALQKAGVKTCLNPTHLPSGVPTGRSFVLVTPDAQRTMCTHLGATGSFSRQDLKEDAIKEAEYLYIEGYLAAQADATIGSIAAYQEAKAHGTRIAITLSDPNMVTHCKGNLLKMIGDGVDLLFCNEQEALLFTQTDTIEAASNVLKHYAHQFVITLGARGSLVCDGESNHFVEGYPVKAVDTVGAGDMFAGAFLYGITHSYSLIQAAKIANYAASRIVMKIGPRLDEDEAANLVKTLRKEAVLV